MSVKTIISIIFCFSCGSLIAETTKIECPKSINAVESLQEPSGEWVLKTDRGKRGKFLDSISVYLGSPEDMGNLIPDQTIQKDRQRKYIWTLNGDNEEAIWAVCSYTNSTLLLTRPLPAKTLKCELTEKLLPTGVKLSIESMSCE